MSTCHDHEEQTDALVAFVTGALICGAATLLYLRVRRNRARAARAHDDDYAYEGGDLFV